MEASFNAPQGKSLYFVYFEHFGAPISICLPCESVRNCESMRKWLYCTLVSILMSILARRLSCQLWPIFLVSGASHPFGLPQGCGAFFVAYETSCVETSIGCRLVSQRDQPRTACAFSLPSRGVAHRGVFLRAVLHSVCLHSGARRCILGWGAVLCCAISLLATAGINVSYPCSSASRTVKLNSRAWRIGSVTFRRTFPIQLKLSHAALIQRLISPRRWSSESL